MKKSLKTVMAVILAGFALATTGCLNAIVDDGAHPIDYAAMSKKKATSSKGGAADADSIGESWGKLFTNTKHGMIDLQPWKGEDISKDFSDGLKLTTGSGWTGGTICQKASVAADNADCVFFDMSKVVKMTFEGKASKNLSVIGTFTGVNGQGIQDSEKTGAKNFTTEWQTFEVVKTGCAKAYAPFVWICESVSSGDVIQVRNITYYDASGNSVAIKYAN